MVTRENIQSYLCVSQILHYFFQVFLSTSISQKGRVLAFAMVLLTPCWKDQAQRQARHNRWIRYYSSNVSMFRHAQHGLIKTIHCQLCELLQTFTVRCMRDLSIMTSVMPLKEVYVKQTTLRNSICSGFKKFSCYYEKDKQ